MATYTLEKRMEISASHCLDLPYASKCKKIHGHNWIITVTLAANELTSYGMIMDFVYIKRIVNQLDHNNINDIIHTNPTAENIACWVYDKINSILLVQSNSSDAWVEKVCVQESEGNKVTRYASERA